MALNCKNIIVTAIKLAEPAFLEYLQQFKSRLEVAFPGSTQQRVKVVPQDIFVSQVLSDPLNVGICYSKIGMVESSMLNRQKGVRAAILQNKYIAYMCRQHNDANMIVLGVESLGKQISAELIMTYLVAGFDHEEKNAYRIAMFHGFENKEEKKL